jgi:catechol 2,3-dioxygenase-like lactoylglutathione lyase family enzyme
VIEMTSVAPVLPTRDLAASLAHYAKLGFNVDRYAGGGYGYVHWGEVDMHLTEWAEHDPKRTAAQVYLYVSDADALYGQWGAAGVAGRFTEPGDAPYGLREAAHVDPEGNLIRYGSWLPGFGPGA